MSITRLSTNLNKQTSRERERVNELIKAFTVTRTLKTVAIVYATSREDAIEQFKFEDINGRVDCDLNKYVAKRNHAEEEAVLQNLNRQRLDS